MKSGVITLGSVIAAVGIALLVGIQAIKRQRARSSPLTPQARLFNQVHYGFLEVAYLVREAGASNRTIATWEDLCEAITNRFPETSILPTNANPFPDFLPQGQYGRSLDLNLDPTNSDSPVIWRRLHLDQDVVLYITSDGAIRSEYPRRFDQILANRTNRVVFDR